MFKRLPPNWAVLDVLRPILIQLRDLAISARVLQGAFEDLCAAFPRRQAQMSWGGFTRPDYVNVTYSWRRRTADPVNIALGVPATMVGMPDDLYFTPGVSVEQKEVGLVATTDRAVALTAVDYALKGIFWVHEKLFSWAIGPFKPF